MTNSKPNPNEQRYTAAAIVLHRAITAAIVSNLFVGSGMKGAIGEATNQARAIAANWLGRLVRAARG